MDQVQPYVKDNQVDLDNLAALIDILDTAFGKANRVAEVEAKLCTTKQRTWEFSSYYTKF